MRGEAESESDHPVILLPRLQLVRHHGVPRTRPTGNIPPSTASILRSHTVGSGGTFVQRRGAVTSQSSKLCGFAPNGSVVSFAALAM